VDGVDQRRLAASQRAKAEALGLPGRLDLLLFSDTLGVECRKPSPVPFRRVMEHFDAGASDCVYIGDNPIKDFIGARRLGWKTVRVRRPLGEHARAEPEPGYEADEEYADLSFIARHE
jgi:putative hydrolase of the HAD superfamily